VTLSISAQIFSDILAFLIIFFFF